MKFENEMNVDVQMIVEPIGTLRNGGFDDCALSGQRYELESGGSLWDVTLVSADNFRPIPKLVNARCLEYGDRFRCSSVEVTPPSFDVQRGAPIDIDQDVKQGVLSVIRIWENVAR